MVFWCFILLFRCFNVLWFSNAGHLSYIKSQTKKNIDVFSVLPLIYSHVDLIVSVASVS